MQEALATQPQSVDLAAELHLFADQIVNELLFARAYDVVVCDRSVLSVVAYTRRMIRATDAQSREMLRGLETYVKAYIPFYDARILLSDCYSPMGDRGRDPDLEFQAEMKDEYDRLAAEIESAAFERIQDGCR